MGLKIAKIGNSFAQDDQQHHPMSSDLSYRSFFQFERDGYIQFEDFYSSEEIDEMLKAGKAMCSQAPKEDRKIFSTTDPESSQVCSDLQFIRVDKKHVFVNFRIAKSISSSRAIKSAIFSKPVPLEATTSCWCLKSSR